MIYQPILQSKKSLGWKYDPPFKYANSDGLATAN